MLCVKCKKRQAVFFVTKIENNKQTQEGYCLQCARELNIGPINQIMEKMGISEEDIDMISEQVTEILGDGNGDFEFGGAPSFPFMGNMNMPTEEQTEEEAPKDSKGDKKGKKSKHKTSRKSLKLYCTNLTEKAKHGEIDRIIGRENEIARAIQILCRRSKNNPCLIGEPGVGKTAIAEGLALRIANGDVPARLMDKEIHLLDLTALVAGTQFRGQFESRIKALVDEVKAEGNIILFIDEVHNIVGAGEAEGSMNAANILKPALSRGEIQVIGATTFTEYRKHIEKDAALERRFQPVKVEEPSIQDTFEMLVGI
ncbi:MAG: AAA family ATPase, partial [Clostridia bacterium]|nr:AAA family ATPase [Clostridia bacterium]